MNIEDLVRSLPESPEILSNLINGTYTLEGGVVRYAAGTGKGGQIVRHLVIPGDAQNAQQRLQELKTTISSGMGRIEGGLNGLQQSMDVLQGLQVANLVMSGLNLAVTTAGFVIVCKKLDGISSQIQAQSEGIALTVKIAGEIHERTLLNDEARFRSLLLSAQQFCAEGDTSQLRSLIPTFHQEYQFTKLILERHATIASSNIDRLSEISLLQDRLINLGLGLSHVQLEGGSPQYAKSCLSSLVSDLSSLNSGRIDTLLATEVATSMKRQNLDEITHFLNAGKEKIPAISYQANVIDLELKHPGLLKRTMEGDDILLIAA